MRQHPDFQKVFSDYFGRVPRKITYEVRRDSNCYHDMAFISSLIHDARFRLSDVNLRGKRLTIDMNRDCWELGMLDKKGSSELHIADSRLTITSVVDLEWNYQYLPDFDESTELWIINIFYSPDELPSVARSVAESVRLQNPKIKDDFVFSFPDRITLNGWFWSLQIALFDAKIKLSDKEVPYLFSERKKTASRK
jgi:hypothetical protein